MIAQFKQGCSNKTFSLQDQGKCHENDTLRKKIKFWPNVIDMGGPIPEKVNEYDYNVGMGYYVCKAETFSRIREVKFLLDILRHK